VQIPLACFVSLLEIRNTLKKIIILTNAALVPIQIVS
jgi:hypothetical protein